MNDHDNLCPECNGLGYVEGECIFMGGQYEPPEYEDVVCPACDGTGTLATIPAEEEAARSAYQAIGGTLHTERHKGRDVLTLPWPIRPR